MSIYIYQNLIFVDLAQLSLASNKIMLGLECVFQSTFQWLIMFGMIPINSGLNVIVSWLLFFIKAEFSVCNFNMVISQSGCVCLPWIKRRVCLNASEVNTLL